MFKLFFSLNSPLFVPSEGSFALQSGITYLSSKDPLLTFAPEKVVLVVKVFDHLGFLLLYKLLGSRAHTPPSQTSSGCFSLFPERVTKDRM